MKLIDYVIQNDSEIERITARASSYDIDLLNYIYEGYCPSAFAVLNNTEYENPFKRDIQERNRCKYEDGEDLDKCKECWNRKILTMK